MENLFRSRICKELQPIYDACAGFDLSDLNAFIQKATEAEMAALKADDAVHVYEKMIPGPIGAPEIKLRIYEPVKHNESLPGILFFHGGGFIFGSVYRQESLGQRCCKATNTVIVSVEYRLAPKWKAPAAAEDGYASLCYVAEHASDFGIDAARIGLWGLSGGGNICAAVTLMARDRPGPKPIFSMPLYAELDHRFITKSSKDIDTPKVWSYRYSVISWNLNLTEGIEPNYYVSPSICEDLSGLPPTFSFIGGLDPFRDENLDYWKRMLDAGVDVEFHVYPGCFHGFDLSAPDSTYGKAAVEASFAFIRQQTAPPHEVVVTSLGDTPA